jgi:predicted DNA-binding protein
MRKTITLSLDLEKKIIQLSEENETTQTMVIDAIIRAGIQALENQKKEQENDKQLFNHTT